MNALEGTNSESSSTNNSGTVLPGLSVSFSLFPTFDDSQGFVNRLYPAIQRLRKSRGRGYLGVNRTLIWNLRTGLSKTDCLCRNAYYKYRGIALAKVIERLTAVIELAQRIEQGQSYVLCLKQHEPEIWENRADHLVYVFPQPGWCVWRAFKAGLWECESLLRGIYDVWRAQDDIAECIDHLWACRK
jgi:hypothetical protein